jgi:DNA-binding CsgD family transcriptional regulator
VTSQDDFGFFGSRQKGLGMQQDVSIRTSFGLTAAESRLALRLLTGESLKSAAAALGITYESARSQLKAIFQKTGTHRQGELIALLGRTVGHPAAHSPSSMSGARKDRGH